MSTTTVTTGSPPALADAVRRRVHELHDQGQRTFATSHFRDVGGQVRCPSAWVTDHLIVLEGIGVLRPVRRGCERSWTVNAESGFLR